MPIVHNVPVVELYLEYLSWQWQWQVHAVKSETNLVESWFFLDVWTVGGVLIILGCIDCILVDSPMWWGTGHPLSTIQPGSQGVKSLSTNYGNPRHQFIYTQGVFKLYSQSYIEHSLLWSWPILFSLIVICDFIVQHLNSFPFTIWSN